MTKRTSALLFLVGFAVAGVAGAQDAQPPEWLRAKIAAYESHPPTRPPRAVLRTRYLGKAAYYVPPVCCDIPSELYDDAGSLLCYPSGGFAGGDGRCPTFSIAASPPAVVWRDSRGASAPRQK
jgi:hypothetical protein